MHPEALARIHLLSAMTWLPLFGAIVLAAAPARLIRRPHLFARLWMVACFGCSIPLVAFERALGGVQFIEDMSWIPALGVRYTLGVDGFSSLLILVVAMAGIAASLGLRPEDAEASRERAMALLVLQTTLVGALVSLDAFLFAAFWLAAIVPGYFLLAKRGAECEQGAPLRFAVFALAGSAPMILSILKLVALTVDPQTLANLASVQAGAKTIAGASPLAQALVDSAISGMRSGQGSFNVLVLQAIGGTRLPAGEALVSLQEQCWIFGGLAAAFAVRMALVPFHSWLPDTLAVAPGSIAPVLVSSFTASGTYGMLRFGLPMAPDACSHPWIQNSGMTFSLVGIALGALCVMNCAATGGSLRRAVGYASVAQIGIVAAGLFSLTPSGLSGAVVTVVASGAGLTCFLCATRLAAREGSREPGAIRYSSPRLAAVSGLALLSMTGVPFLAGFIGIVLVVRGVFEMGMWWVAGLAVCLMLQSAALAWVAHTLFSGLRGEHEGDEPADLGLVETGGLLPLVFLLLLTGVYPAPVLEACGRAAQMVAYQVWNKPESRERYAPTPEQQNELTRKAGAAVVPALDLPEAPSEPVAAPADGGATP